MSKKNLILAILLSSFLIKVNAENNLLVQDKTNVDLSFRYRVEVVDMDTFEKDALASTLLTRATLNTQWHTHWDTLIEFDNVSEVGADNYNAGGGNTPNKGQFPIVADPKGTEINQAYIRYNGKSTKLAYGRQRITVGNQRFVGGVSWRQNEQTFDSFTVKNNFNKKFNLSYAYVFNVNTILGEAVAGGNHKHDTHIIDIAYKMDSGKLSTYYFAIDNQTSVTASSNTLGINYTGQWNRFILAAELATQSDAGDNANNYSANYYWLEGLYEEDNYSFGVGYEVLGGDVNGGQSFTTSLATLHKFQGWADAFISRSDVFESAGVKDFYIKAAYKISGFNFEIFMHDFSTEQKSNNLGSEIDFSISKKFTQKLSALFKYASFNSDSDILSRDKVWVMLSYNP